MSGQEPVPGPGSRDASAAASSSETGATDEPIADHYAALVDDLARTLDLSAGLKLAVLPRKHSRMIDDIADAVDLEDGFTAIVREPVASAANLRDRLRYQARDIETLGGIIEWLNSYPVRDRLDFRTHTALSQHAKKLDCGCVGTRTAIVKTVASHAHRLDDAMNEGFAGHQEAIRAATLRARQELEESLRYALSFERPFETDLDALRHGAEAIRRELYERGASTPLRDEWSEIVENLAYLERVLNDFSGADLRSVDLDGLRLAGIRWSNGTRWPDGWRDRIKTNSAELAPGKFKVQSADPALRGPHEV